MFRRKHIWPTILMAGSLCLLTAFEFVWLRSAYVNEKELMQEQLTRHLHSAIRELEDSLIQVKLWTPEGVILDSLACKPTDVRIHHESSTTDSTRLLTVMKNIQVNISDTLHFRHRKPRKGAMILGALSGHVDNTSLDSIRLTVSLSDMISAKLHTLEDNNEPEYMLISWTEAPPDTSGLLSKSYFDVFTGEHYALSSARFETELFQRLLPQILFALILFASIFGAFWLIFRSLVRQRRLAEIRSNLISNITHELKTPIATVHVALEALQNFNADNDRQRRAEYLAIAQSEISRLAILVDKVLKTSDSDGTHAQLHIEKIDLRDLVTHVLDTLKVQFGKVSARVKMDVEGEDFAIEADRLHLTGLVHNLVDNALKYGGQSPEIDLHLTQQNGTLTIRVHDQGIGIPKEYQDKIFDKFFRVPSGDIHNIKGHGLGLSYVAEVVREHHGTIHVTSESGHGTTFTVTLPTAYAN